MADEEWQVVAGMCVMANLPLLPVCEEHFESLSAEDRRKLLEFLGNVDVK